VSVLKEDVPDMDTKAGNPFEVGICTVFLVRRLQIDGGNDDTIIPGANYAV